MRLSMAWILAAALGVAAVASPAYAVKEFYAQLEAKYLKRDSTKQNDLALLIAFEQARCTICHPGNDKHRFTVYGGQLACRLSKFDKANKKKIQAALGEVGALHSDPQDAKSPTYNDLFRQGKLPPGPSH